MSFDILNLSRRRRGFLTFWGYIKFPEGESFEREGAMKRTAPVLGEVRAIVRKCNAA